MFLSSPEMREGRSDVRSMAALFSDGTLSAKAGTGHRGNLGSTPLMLRFPAQKSHHPKESGNAKK
jgi:hypothetical protein